MPAECPKWTDQGSSSTRPGSSSGLLGNALTANADMTVRDGHRSPALPHDRLTELLRESGLRLDHR
ncbi:hypothetical protein AB0H34_22210 [Saccharopolyspora shandongensis]|uniref:hypothetical protein n=1 Tax=Saccharopolyspora shandongensis TaxID=418495 RepID=UPI0033C2D7FA